MTLLALWLVLDLGVSLGFVLGCWWAAVQRDAQEAIDAAVMWARVQAQLAKEQAAVVAADQVAQQLPERQRRLAHARQN